MIISTVQKIQTLYRTEVFSMQTFSAPQLVWLHQSLGSTLQPVLNAIKSCWYGSLRTVTTYPTFTSWKLPFDFLQCSLRYPNENTSLCSGVDFAEISSFSLVILHLRGHSLVLPPYEHLGERSKELTFTNQIHHKTCMSQVLHTLSPHNRTDV